MKIRPFADHPEVELEWLLYPVPASNGVGPASVFVHRWYDWRSEHWEPPGVGTLPWTMQNWNGPYPDPALGELVGTDDEWENGLDYQRWLDGGYSNPNGCHPLGKRLWFAGGLDVSAFDRQPQAKDLAPLEVGASALVLTGPVTGAAGLEVGGTAPVSPSWPGGPVAALDLAGLATLLLTWPGGAPGPLEVGGSALVAVLLPEAMAAALEVSASALVISGKLPPLGPAGLEMGGSGVLGTGGIRSTAALELSGQRTPSTADTVAQAQTVWAGVELVALVAVDQAQQIRGVEQERALLKVAQAQQVTAAVQLRVTLTVQQAQQVTGAVAMGALIPTGGIMPWAGATAPAGFLLCDGSLVSRTTYSALFAVLGTTYGAGDGSTTFAIPNLNGRVPLGAGTGGALPNTAHTLGTSGGEERHTLALAELPAHQHGYFSFNGLTGYGVVTSGSWGYSVDSRDALATDPAGSGTPHNNVQPFLSVGYIIAT